MGKATDNYTPEQRVAMAERARLLKSPRRQAEKDLMRQIGEKLRKVETARADTEDAQAGRWPQAQVHGETATMAAEKIQSRPEGKLTTGEA